MVDGRRTDGGQQIADGRGEDGCEALPAAREALPGDPERALSLLPADSDDPRVLLVRGRALAAADRIDRARAAFEAALDRARDLPTGGVEACRTYATVLRADGEAAAAARHQWVAAVLVCDREGPFAGAGAAAETVRWAPRCSGWVDAAALIIAADSLRDHPAAPAAADGTVGAAARTARTEIAAAPDPAEPTAELLAVAAVTGAATSPEPRDWDLAGAVERRDWATLRERVLAAVRAEAVALRDA